MIVKSLELSEYRNYPELHVEFSPGVNLIHGDNAQGKTNVLEAIFECAAARSHRGTKDRDIIRFGQEEAHVRLIMERDSIPTRIDLHLKKNKTKGVAVNGVPIQRASELFGRLHAVFFSPEDLRIIKNSPAERRHFLDSELCQLSGVYTYNLGNYSKVLLQRNNILKDSRNKKEMLAVLDVWDEQLVSFGEKIMDSRQEFIRELGEIIGPIHRQLTGGLEELTLKYAPDTPKERLGERLFLERDNDLRLGSSSVGPHRDDMEFYVNGIDVRRFGSQGQQRTSALSLKLAEIELVKKKIHDTPVLLLDDVLSELDSGRQDQLLKSLSAVQTFLTCTGTEDFIERSVNVGKRFLVKEGKMLEEEINE